MNAASTPPDGGDADRTGLMIIRAWVEEGSTQPLRAQVRLSRDVSAGVEGTFTFTTADDVCAAVRTWLAEIMQMQGTEERT